MAPNARRLDDQGRKAERLALDQPTRLRPNGWSSCEARMRDLSSLGFRARCDVRLQRGGCVWLDLPGIGEVEAQVEWQRAGEFGARFLSPIDLGRCSVPLAAPGSPLARLLVDRAGAREAGRDAIETALRRKILAALPMRRSGG
ncbi:MAG TPA: hypothetical protein VF727_02565 [Allosphingosinicella sp.]|jgi:hypothetical protein